MSSRIEWTTLDDGHEGAARQRRRDGRRRGAFCANAGEDLHAVESLAPIIDAIGCIVIRTDGSRVLARAVPAPLA